MTDAAQPVTGAAQIAQQVTVVARLRRIAADLAAEMRARVEAFDAANAAVLAHAKEAAADVDAAESALRALTLDHYGRTGEAKPTAGVEVKLYDTFALTDPAAALAWAKASGVALIPESVDQRALFKVAKVSPLPFVAAAKEPRVSIATDLAKALAQ